MARSEQRLIKRWVFGGLLAVSGFTSSVWAECRDRDAWAASDLFAQRFFKHSEVFKRARVLKVHHPSRRKEVVSYIKTGDKYYSMFTLVDDQCVAVFRKRTRQND